MSTARTFIQNTCINQAVIELIAVNTRRASVGKLPPIDALQAMRATIRDAHNSSQAAGRDRHDDDDTRSTQHGKFMFLTMRRDTQCDCWCR